MFVGGNGTIELILLVMIAGFLVLRLRSVLGRRVGFERPAATSSGIRPTAPAVIDGAAEPAGPARDLPPPDSKAGRGLSEIQRADPSFTAGRFLAGAEGAFRIIVTAFAEGDRVALRPLLDDRTYAGFESAIVAREEAKETQRSEVKAIRSVTIETAGLAGSIATIGVRFVSDQVNARFDSAGAPVHGTDAVTELTDLWTFERDVAQGGPAWVLTSARPA